MRALQTAAFLLGSLLVAQATIFACSKSSTSDADSDDSGDASDANSPFTFDVAASYSDSGVDYDALANEETAFFSGDGGCGMTDGVYTVTATAADDSGAQCPPWTTTVSWPPQGVDGGGDLTVVCPVGPGVTDSDPAWTTEGESPNCGIAFQCASNNGIQSTQTTGTITAFGNAYAAQAEIEYFAEDGGTTPLYTCVYGIDYTLQP